MFASIGFWELTGYKPSEILGRNCRFLQVCPHVLSLLPSPVPFLAVAGFAILPALLLCRYIMQGKDTDPRAVRLLSESVSAGKDIQVRAVVCQLCSG